MGFLSNGYEVIVQPAILVVTAIVALVFMVRGFHRTTEVVDDLEIKRTRFNRSALKSVGITLAVGVLTYLAIVVVPFGHRGVIWSAAGGVNDAERQPGISFVVPILQAPVVTDVREQRITTVDSEGKANAVVQSSELLQVWIKSTLIYNVDSSHASNVIDEIGSDYPMWMETIFRDVIREVAGDHDAPDFGTDIDVIAREMEQAIQARVAPRFNIVSVNIEDAIFEEPFLTAVRDEEVAEREADEQENLVRAREAEKRQRVIAAEAAAEEARLFGVGERDRIAQIAEALEFTSEEYLRWLLLNQWNGQLPNTLLGEGGDLGIILNQDSAPAPTPSEGE